jgi:hypothetical protein
MSGFVVRWLCDLDKIPKDSLRYRLSAGNMASLICYVSIRGRVLAGWLKKIIYLH